LYTTKKRLSGYQLTKHNKKRGQVVIYKFILAKAAIRVGQGYGRSMWGSVSFAFGLLTKPFHLTMPTARDMVNLCPFPYALQTFTFKEQVV
jgi:hypothetical protein